MLKFPILYVGLRKTIKGIGEKNIGRETNWEFSGKWG